MKKKILFLFASLTFSSSFSSFNVNASTYTIKSGDTLWGISRNYNVSVDQLVKWNQIKNNTLYIGQKLTVSTPNTSTSNGQNGNVNSSNKVHVVKPGETLWGISRNYKLNTNDIIIWNNLKSTTLYVGQSLKLNSTITTNTGNSNTTSTNTVSPNTGNSNSTNTGQQYGTVSASLLNVRSGPNGTVIDTISKGTRVSISSSSGDWYKVTYGNKTGWVSKSYLKLETINTLNSSTNTNSNTIKYALVNASALNFRTSPGGSIITMIPNGSKVQVLSTQDTWSKITYNGTTGWVSSSYLTETKENSVNNSTNNSNKNFKVLLDPGHGGADAGAVNGSVYEKHLAMTYANKTKNYLESMGYSVFLTRNGDSSCVTVYSLTADLQCRADKSKTLNADIFVSIHFNALIPGVVGTETYYNSTTYSDGSKNPYPSQSKLLAESIHNRYQPAMKSTNRGVINSNFYVLRKNKVPSTLLEVGFLTDSRDLNKVINNTYQNDISYAIAQGINDYYTKTKK